MRIGLVELFLILLIAAVAIGPRAMLLADRWLRRANRAGAAAARRRAALEAQRAAEREEVLQRFQKVSIVFVLIAAAALVWTLVLRPIEASPQPYAVPDLRQDTGAREVRAADTLRLSSGDAVSALHSEGDWLYAAAQSSKTSALLRMQPDGSGLTEVLTLDGTITDFAFAPDGSIWLTVLDADGGKLYRASNDQWGVTTELIVRQVDGKALSCPTAVAADANGRIYFTDAAAAPARHGAESALRTELIAHTATGWVYVYDPAARTVERVLGGIAGASGLALDRSTQTLYVSDLGSRCVWSVHTSARELTAGGKDCLSFVSGLPGYPGALALGSDGELSISYRWTRSGWLEDHADSTFLRGAALRLSQTMQEDLFSLPSDGICAEIVSSRTGQWLLTVSGGGSCTALCPVENRLYLGTAGKNELYFARR